MEKEAEMERKGGMAKRCWVCGTRSTTSDAVENLSIGIVLERSNGGGRRLSGGGGGVMVVAVMVVALSG